MVRILLPTLLIAIAAGMFVLFTNPLYQEVKTLRAESVSYKEALGNSKALENERDKLTQKYNAIDPQSLSRLQKLLPDNVDNIRLILEIEKIALPYGMALRNVKYATEEKKVATPEGVAPAPEAQTKPSNGNYGSWDLEFSTSGSYFNFLNFLRDLERNLRIVDVSSISFSSEQVPGAASDIYRYDFKIKTYWLKN